MCGHKADFTAGSLKLPESRIIAELLPRKLQADNHWLRKCCERDALIPTRNSAAGENC